VAFQIHVKYTKFTIKCTVIVEGALKSVMSLSYWKAIGSPPLSQSMTIFTKFYGYYFIPHAIHPALPVYIGGKTVEVKVEVVDVPLYYNPLLGCNWTYAMTIIVLSIFHILFFLREGNIVTIN
jgi:hypothetical protein